MELCIKPLLKQAKSQKNAEYVTICWKYVSIKVNRYRAGSTERNHEELKIKKIYSKIMLNYG